MEIVTRFLLVRYHTNLPVALGAYEQRHAAVAVWESVRILLTKLVASLSLFQRSEARTTGYNRNSRHLPTAWQVPGGATST